MAARTRCSTDEHPQLDSPPSIEGVFEGAMGERCAVLCASGEYPNRGWSRSSKNTNSLSSTRTKIQVLSIDIAGIDTIENRLRNQGVLYRIITCSRPLSMP